MLTLNIWEGDDKVSLVTNGRAAYGHAALVLEAQGDSVPRSLYMSWWPGDGEEEEIKVLGKTKGKTVNRQEERTFREDLWAENNNRYLTDLVFTAPTSSERQFWSTANDGTPEEHVRFLFRNNGQALPEHEPWDDKPVLSGTLERSPGHWVIDVPHENRLYLCWNGKQGIKVQLHQGHRFLFEETIQGIGTELDDLIGPEDVTRVQTEDVPDSIRGPLEAHHFPVHEDAEIRRVSERQWAITSPKHDYYLVATDMGRTKVRFYRWTRQGLAPSRNIRIPTLTADGRGLDDRAMARWWAAFNADTNPKWSTFDRNCSVIVATALRVGGATRFAKPHVTASWLCWTPSDIATYGEALALAIGKKEKKRQKKEQRTQGTGGPRVNPLLQGGRGTGSTQRPGWTTGRVPQVTGGQQGGFVIGSTRTRQEPPDQPPQQPVPQQEEPQPAPVWTKQQFRDQTKSNTFLSGRNSDLTLIDTALQAYHLTYHGQTQARINKLNAVLDAIAKLTLKHPDSKKLGAVYELAEQVVAQRLALVALL